MKCQKCLKDFPEERFIHEHHLIPISLNKMLLKKHKQKFPEMGEEEYKERCEILETIPLCEKCHHIIHNMIPKQIFKFVSEEKKEICLKELKKFTQWWLKNDPTTT